MPAGDKTPRRLHLNELLNAILNELLSRATIGAFEGTALRIRTSARVVRRDGTASRHPFG
jgi:hypothetical protein